MKIVILAPVHAYDDIRVFRKEAVTLAAAGHEVVLHARTPDGRPLRRDGVLVRPVKYRHRLSRFAQMPVFGHRLFREGADVYHVHNPDTLPIAFALKLRGARVVYDTHEDFRTELLLRTWLPGILRRPAAAVVSATERRAGRWLDAVIVTQEQLLDRIPRGRPIVQLTYGPKSPVPPGLGDYTVERFRFVIRNIPPTQLWIYRRPLRN